MVIGAALGGAGATISGVTDAAGAGSSDGARTAALVAARGASSDDGANRWLAAATYAPDAATKAREKSVLFTAGALAVRCWQKLTPQADGNLTVAVKLRKVRVSVDP
jgi:hypothetical protein